jgi:hypothetical protein
MRSNTTQRNNRAHLSIGACALLLPPLTLGAAFYSMLASPDDGAVAGASAVSPESVRDTAQHRAVSADPQPVTQATQPIAVAGGPAPPEGMARVSDSVPVQVTSALPAGENPPAVVDGALRGALGAEPSQSAPAEVSTALLPRALTSPSQMPLQMPPPRMPIARMPAAQPPPAADPPSPESALAPPLAARKHGRPSYLANLTGRNGARTEARSETPAARRNVQPQPQQAFSLKNWLQQQLGIRPHNTRG